MNIKPQMLYYVLLGLWPRFQSQSKIEWKSMTLWRWRFRFDRIDEWEMMIDRWHCGYQIKIVGKRRWFSSTGAVTIWCSRRYVIWKIWITTESCLPAGLLQYITKKSSVKIWIANDFIWNVYRFANLNAFCKFLLIFIT